MLKAGTHVGPYEILDLLGVGGMGEVYRARDTKLAREVALKVLPEDFAQEPERLARFRREAQLLASLNHPNIAAIYGMEDSGDLHCLVMELVPGETLAQQLKAGPVEIEDALRITQQIAEALEAAHEKGIIHRDLKPANIKLTPEGKVKVLDFGLAKAMAPEPSSSQVWDTNMPTASTPGRTRPGVIMGTAAYMSPEQAKGKPTDKRTDLWALGCVLYELLTATQAFQGETVTEILASILKGEPEWDALPAHTPPNIRFVLRRCLQKDVQKRFRDAADVAIQIEETLSAPASKAIGIAPVPIGLRKPIPLGMAGLIAAVVAIAASVAVWTLRPAAPASDAQVTRLTMNLGPDEQFDNFQTPLLALSPDGSKITYIARRGAGRPQLYLRSMDDLDAKPIAGTEGARAPFFSPDSRWIGFFAQGKLKKVSVFGGGLETICDVPSGVGGSWAADNSIVFAPTLTSGLWRVAASGGTPQELTKLDRSSGETGHRWPQVLPGGKAVLFTIGKGPGWDENHLAVQNLETGERKILIRGTYAGAYVPPGQLVYWRAGDLVALPFDLAKLQVTDDVPIKIADAVMRAEGSGGAQVTTSSAGSIAYVPAGPHPFERRLVWVDRQGKVEPLPTAPRFYRGGPTLSPDGKQVALTIVSGTQDIWIQDLARDTLTRLTSEGGSSQFPLWTPDAKRMAYRGTRTGFRNLFWKPVDGTGVEERLTTSENLQNASSWSPDGRVLAFQDTSPATGSDIWILPIEGERKPQVFLKTQFGESGASFSPDGRWLAYSSNQSGRGEVYVQPYPGPGQRWQISTEGGANPRWNRNGRELFYTFGDKVFAVEVTTSPAFSVGRPRLLFEASNEGYDVSPDGQRFLMVQAIEPERPPTQINIVLNWFEELKRNVPVK